MEFLAWPVVVLLLAGGFLVGFKRQIGRLLDRTHGVSVGKVDMQALPQQRIEKPSVADQILQAPASRLLGQQEQSIRDNLEQLGVTDPAERENLLVRDLAQTKLRESFERLYQELWGSQLAALQLINQHSAEITQDGTRSFFEDAKREQPEQYGDYSFEEWFEFLVDAELVSPTEDEKVAITVQGRELLTYITAQGYSLYKDY
jgi:hypothetical protein